MPKEELWTEYGCVLQALCEPGLEEVAILPDTTNMGWRQSSVEEG